MLGRTRIHTRARGSGAGAGSTTTTALQQILALSPSLLVWPANGAGWQGTSGGTLAASGQPLGLGVDLSQLGGTTLSEWLASVTPLALGTWTQVVGTGTITGSGADVSFASAADNNYASPAGVLVSGSVYEITVNVSAISAGSVRSRIGGVQTLGTQATTGSVTYVVSAAATDFRLVAVATTTATVSVTIKLLPGNHLRAGTWASPSDAARGTFQNNAINFDGSTDYYSLLNAISITTDMTVVRAFKRATTGINSHGLGAAAATEPREASWTTANNLTTGLGATAAGVANTSTGSAVTVARRSASAEIIRLNGTQVYTRSPPTVTGSFDAFGRIGSLYNSGEISFLAVFPTELTGANLALVEQIAAQTNGAVLA